MDFNVHVTESGVEYNETIEVDTQKQTEVFKVPAHPGVDRSDVMHDFKQVGGSSFKLLTVVFSNVATLLFSSVATAFAFNSGGASLFLSFVILLSIRVSSHSSKICLGLTVLASLQQRFLRVLLFGRLPQNRHFQIPIRSYVTDEWQMKNYAKVPLKNLLSNNPSLFLSSCGSAHNSLLF